MTLHSTCKSVHVHVILMPLNGQAFLTNVDYMQLSAEVTFMQFTQINMSRMQRL